MRGWRIVISLAAGHVTLLHSVAELARIELLVADFEGIPPHNIFGMDRPLDGEQEEFLRVMATVRSWTRSWESGALSKTVQL